MGSALGRYFFFDERFFEVLVFFFGTFAPDARASDNPIAIACLRLVTFLPERPDFNLPRFFSCIARSTFSPAFLLYFAMRKELGKARARRQRVAMYRYAMPNVSGSHSIVANFALVRMIATKASPDGNCAVDDSR